MNSLFEAVKSFFSQKEIKKKEEIRKKSEFPIQQIEQDYGVKYDPFQIFSSKMTLISKIEDMNNKIRQWRYMSQIPEVDEAIDIIINEWISFDGINDPIKINLDDVEISKKIKNKIIESFEKCINLLDFAENGYELLREFYIDGQKNFEVIYSDKISNGIEELLPLSPFNLFKITNPKTGETQFFYKFDPTFKLVSDYQNADKIFNEEQIIHVDFKRYSTDKSFPVSYLDKAIKVINQLVLIEDSLIIYRITRSPEKRVFYIDTGNLPKTQAEQYVQQLISKFRQKKVYDIETGTIKGNTKSISILEDFWFPVSANNKGTRVETLPGTSANLEDLADLDYFVNKVYKALNVPPERRKQEAVVNFNNTGEMERAEVRFYKFILRLRQATNRLFLEFLKRDLLYKKILSFEDWEKIKSQIKFIYNSDNLYALIKKLDTLSMKIDVVNNADALRESGYLSKEYIWKNVLQFTDKEIKEIKDQLKQEEQEENEELEEFPEEEFEEPEEMEKTKETKESKQIKNKKATINE